MKVKNSNIFRAQNKSLVDHFIISYFATDDALRSYCKAGIPQKWIRAAKDTSFPKINVSDYEESLINFFKSRIKNEKSHPILVLVGGIGTGKSSTIRYALHTSNICNNCSYSSICTRDYGSRIIIDFINFKSTLDTYSEDAKYNKSLRKSQVKEFWINILKILDIVLKEEMGIEIEISDFWIWLVNDKRDSISIEIYKLLYPKREMFSNSVQNSAELRNLRTEFYTELSIANLVKYKLLQISFLRKDKMANCNFIIFDNTDTLPPKLQKKVIDFSIYANNLLHCISIIPLRPSTLFANRDASTFFDLKEHWKPSLQNIFYTRLENYKKNGDQDVYLLLKMLIDTIRDNKFFSDVIISTSGKSIRYALRNFYKFCLSPLIVTHVDGKPVEYILLQTNSFYQAYFCSDSELQVMDEENFTNMLALRTSPMNSFFSNLKMRLLHMLYIREEIKLGQIFETLTNFGYEPTDIKNSLNDFLNNNKALILSSEQNKYHINDLNCNCEHLIRISELGIKYYCNLISQPLYLRECIISVKNNREVFKIDNYRSLVSELSDLFIKDLEEIRKYISLTSVKEYLSFFQSSELSISCILWNTVKNNIKHWISDLPNVEFDPQREHFLNNEVRKVLDDF